MSHHLLSNKAFTKFLKDQGDAPYEYYFNNSCAIAQYFHSRGFPQVIVGGAEYQLKGGDSRHHTLPDNWDLVASGGHGLSMERTFSAAYQRAVDLELV